MRITRRKSIPKKNFLLLVSSFSLRAINKITINFTSIRFIFISATTTVRYLYSCGGTFSVFQAKIFKMKVGLAKSNNTTGGSGEGNSVSDVYFLSSVIFHGGKVGITDRVVFSINRRRYVYHVAITFTPAGERNNTTTDTINWSTNSNTDVYSFGICMRVSAKGSLSNTTTFGGPDGVTSVNDGAFVVTNNARV